MTDMIPTSSLSSHFPGLQEYTSGLQFIDALKGVNYNSSSSSASSYNSSVRHVSFWQNKRIDPPDTIVYYLQHVMNMDGKNDENFKLQPILIVLYATWCSACRIEAPVIEKFANDYQGRVQTMKIQGHLLADIKLTQDMIFKLNVSDSNAYEIDYQEKIKQAENVKNLIDYYPTIALYHPLTRELLQIQHAHDLNDCADQILRDLQRQSPYSSSSTLTY